MGQPGAQRVVPQSCMLSGQRTARLGGTMNPRLAKVLFGFQLTLLGIFVTWMATLTVRGALQLATLLVGLLTMALGVLVSYQATRGE
jgi:hypothetical protein